jgi:RNA polymerase sigma factor (TIGR02999 family)
MDPTISQLLRQWSGGDEKALERLMPLVYDELRRLARSYLRRERPDHTLQPTALVNEAYLRLIEQRSVTWKNRAHFFGIAAQMMRRILVNHALAKRAAKRGGFADTLTLEDAEARRLVPDARGVDVLSLDEALQELARLDERQSRVVELRYFGGLSIEEAAAALDLSPATVKREWSTARVWLRRRLTRT